VSYEGNSDPDSSFQAYLNTAVERIEPASGLHTGGDLITLVGIDFRAQYGKTRMLCRFANDPRAVAEGSPQWLVTDANYESATQISCLTPAVIAPIDRLGTGREAVVQYTLNGEDWEDAGMYTFEPIPICFTCNPGASGSVHSASWGSCVGWWCVLFVCAHIHACTIVHA